VSVVPSVRVVVPDGIDDPARPSGGNRYDRRTCDGLASLGWSVGELPVAGPWPWPDRAARDALATALRSVPDRTVVLLDGLVASTVPEVVVPESGRLRLVVLVHMPLEERRAEEREVLASAAAVLTTSGWTRDLLLRRHGLAPGAVHVASPGVDAAELAAGSPDGGQLLCVAAVTPGKGHDVLLEALGAVAHRPWHCVCVGSLDRDRAFVDRVRRRADELGLGDRVSFPGPRVGARLAASYAAADALVLASRAETYGMVVTEALAHGLPTVAAAVGGLPEALGHAPDGSRPGLLVPPDDPSALAGALEQWLADPAVRAVLRTSARGRRATLTGWTETARCVSDVLTGVAA
jgi:glycosyltransferase involved in cell wall biosynthesis